MCCHLLRFNGGVYSSGICPITIMFFTNCIGIFSSYLFIGYYFMDRSVACTFKWIPILRLNKQHGSIGRNDTNRVCWSWTYDSQLNWVNSKYSLLLG